MSETFRRIVDLVHRGSRVAALWNPAHPVFQERQLGEAKVAVQKLGVQLQVVEARAPGEFDRAFSAIAGERAEALWVLVDHRPGRAAGRLAGAGRLDQGNPLDTVLGPEYVRRISRGSP